MISNFDMNNIEFNGTALSVIGASHIKSGKVCQDRSSYIAGPDYNAVMVSDGHGNERHFRSQVGAEIARGICENEVGKFAEAVSKGIGQRQREKMLKDFEKYIIFSWRNRVDDDLKENPFLPEELGSLTGEIRLMCENDPYIAYGATFILSIACAGYLYIIQLGDGDCIIKTPYGVFSPLPDDENLKFGKTTSLCNMNASESIRDMILPLKYIKACIISSDGVRNSFDTDEHFLYLCDAMMDESAHSGENLKAELQEFLPELTKKGSGDDVSIAVMSKKLIL